MRNKQGAQGECRNGQDRRNDVQDVGCEDMVTSTGLSSRGRHHRA
ncbi:MAG: hypothetical protein WD847_21120 [Pirellulales bacterium]